MLAALAVSYVNAILMRIFTVISKLAVTSDEEFAWLEIHVLSNFLMLYEIIEAFHLLIKFLDSVFKLIPLQKIYRNRFNFKFYDPLRNFSRVVRTNQHCCVLKDMFDAFLVEIRVTLLVHQLISVSFELLL